MRFYLCTYVYIYIYACIRQHKCICMYACIYVSYVHIPCVSLYKYLYVHDMFTSWTHQASVFLKIRPELVEDAPSNVHSKSHGITTLHRTWAFGLQRVARTGLWDTKTCIGLWVLWMLRIQSTAVDAGKLQCFCTQDVELEEFGEGGDRRSLGA